MVGGGTDATTAQSFIRSGVVRFDVSMKARQPCRRLSAYANQAQANEVTNVGLWLASPMASCLLSATEIVNHRELCFG